MDDNIADTYTLYTHIHGNDFLIVPISVGLELAQARPN